jgi:ornithine carbamoyltransferase
MADVMTFEELKGPIKAAQAWIGDANNVATSWVHAAARFGFSSTSPRPRISRRCPSCCGAKQQRAEIEVSENKLEAARV